MKGTVQAISAKEFNGTLLFSAKIGENWVGFGSDKPTFNKGDLIEVDVTTNNRGRLVAVKDTVKPITQGTQVIEGSKPWAKNAKDDYWTRKEERDILTQSVIQLQSSRNSAIAMASLLLQAGAIPGYDKAAEKKKMDILVSLVDDLTDRFEETSDARRHGKPEKASNDEVASPDDSEEKEIWGD